MTIIEAIKEVMRQTGGPMTSADVYSTIIAKGLYTFHAQRPSDIVRGEIRSHCKGIDFPSAGRVKHFELLRDGRFFVLPRPVRTPTGHRMQRGAKHSVESARDSAARILGQLKALHVAHREAVRARILSDLKKLEPATFEMFAKRLLEVYGFSDMQVTQVSRDGGIDGYGRLKVGLAHLNVAFQCKRWRGTVGRPEVDRFRGAIQGAFEQGMFFTTSAFAPGAEEISFRPGAVPIILIDGDSIVNLMMAKDFGVQTETLPVYSCALDLAISGES